MEQTFPDTLVLKIVERDNLLRTPDTTLYLIYDKRHRNYIIRGMRRGTHHADAVQYSFTCETMQDLADFIQFVIDKKNRVSYILYNYDNLPEFSSEITFDFLRENDTIDYEIAGYDNRRLKRHSLLRNLRMLKNVFNYY